MIDEGRVEDFASEIDSKRPDAVGDMAGDTGDREDRKANQAAGQAYDLHEWIVDEIQQLMTGRSFGALLAAMATGMAIGFLTSRGYLRRRATTANPAAKPRRTTCQNAIFSPLPFPLPRWDLQFPTAPAADGMGVQLSDCVVPDQLGSVMLCMTNPNPDALVFDRVTITLDRAGMPLAAGSSSAPIVVPALSWTRVPLAVVASERDRPGQRGGSLRPHNVDYRVDGSVALDRAFGLNISYRHSGHLDIVSSSIDGVLSRCAGSDVAVPL